jgi:hypothetical protein
MFDRIGSCLTLMIWSSRARNRSLDLVVSAFFGRIANFRGLGPRNLAISNLIASRKLTRDQSLRNCARATDYRAILRRNELSTSDGHLQRMSVSMG